MEPHWLDQLTLLDYDWHQFLVVLPEGGSLDDATVYIDGVAESVTTTGSTDAEVSTVGDKVTLIGNGPSGFFKGWIDDIRIYDRALAASEADKLFKLEENTEPLEPETLKPEITSHPVSLSVASGESATFE